MLTTSANRTILQLNAMQILLIIKLCDPSMQIVLFSRPERNQIVSEQHHVPSVTTNWVVRQSRPTLLRLPIGCCSGVSLVFFRGFVDRPMTTFAIQINFQMIRLISPKRIDSIQSTTLQCFFGLRFYYWIVSSKKSICYKITACFRLRSARPSFTKRSAGMSSSVNCSITNGCFF